MISSPAVIIFFCHLKLGSSKYTEIGLKWWVEQMFEEFETGQFGLKFLKDIAT